MLEELPGGDDSLDALMEDLLPGASGDPAPGADFLQELLPGSGAYAFDLGAAASEFNADDALGALAGALGGDLVDDLEVEDEDEEGEGEGESEGGGGEEGASGSEGEGAEGAGGEPGE
jgi:hypothetical protein